MNTWFTSDLHFGHFNILRYCKRPWKTVEEMIEGIINNLNSVIAKDDVVYYTGDIFWKPHFIAELTPRMNGRKYLISGNHDHTHTSNKANKRADAYVEFEKAGWEVLPEQVEVEEFLLCHFPYTGDSGETDRYPKWRPVDRGQKLLHGHLHSSKENRLRGHMLDVGVDGNDWMPWHIDAVRKELE